MNELISIIVPVYNGEKYITRCLMSIQNQTFSNLDIIIIDDGSTDRTPEIVDEIAKKDKRITVIHQKNKGVSTARNIGLRKVKGEYIGFVDGDDEIYNDMFGLLYDNIKKYDADISHCGFEWVFPNKVIKFYGSGELLIQNRVESVKELLSGKRIEPSICNKLYRRSIISEIEFVNDIKINEDLLFNIRAFQNTQKNIFNDITKYRYIYNPDSASQSEFKIKKLQDIIVVAKKIRQEVTDNELKFAVEKFYVNKLIIVLKELHFRNIQKSEFGISISSELMGIDCSSLGYRIIILKLILLKFPQFYKIFQKINNILFINKRKWNN